MLLLNLEPTPGFEPGDLFSLPKEMLVGPIPNRGSAEIECRGYRQ
jgi:hypothetical protein